MKVNEWTQQTPALVYEPLILKDIFNFPSRLSSDFLTTVGADIYTKLWC